MTTRWTLAGLALLAVLATACGGAEATPAPTQSESDAAAEDTGGDADPEPSTQPEPGQETPKPTEAPPEPQVTPQAPAAPSDPREPQQPLDLSGLGMPTTLPPYSSYVTLTDDTGRITVEVPAEWNDVDGRPLDIDGTTVADLRASSDLAAFASSWNVPGVIISAADLPGETPATILDSERATIGTTCTYEGREPYSDPLYVGQFDTYSSCGGTTAVYVVIAARTADGSGPLIEVQAQVNDDRDLAALERIVASFIAT